MKYREIQKLKVKIKSLAEEARIIRAEEKKSKDLNVRNELYLHRVIDVRREVRLSLIAYAFLRGRDFSEVDSGLKYIDWKRVESLISKYSHSVLEPGYLEKVKERSEKYQQWRDKARVFIDENRRKAT